MDHGCDSGVVVGDGDGGFTIASGPNNGGSGALVRECVNGESDVVGIVGVVLELIVPLGILSV